MCVLFVVCPCALGVCSFFFSLSLCGVCGPVNFTEKRVPFMNVGQICCCCCSIFLPVMYIPTENGVTEWFERLGLKSYLKDCMDWVKRDYGLGKGRAWIG